MYQQFDTTPLNLENRIISLTGGDSLHSKGFSLKNLRIVEIFRTLLRIKKVVSKWGSESIATQGFQKVALS